MAPGMSLRPRQVRGRHMHEGLAGLVEDSRGTSRRCRVADMDPRSSTAFGTDPSS